MAFPAGTVRLRLHESKFKRERSLPPRISLNGAFIRVPELYSIHILGGEEVEDMLLNSINHALNRSISFRERDITGGGKTGGINMYVPSGILNPTSENTRAKYQLMLAAPGTMIRKKRSWLWKEHTVG